MTDTYLDRFPEAARPYADRAYQDGFTDGASAEGLIPDPRRLVIVAHTNSSSPRAERWYGLRIAVDFGEGLIPLSWPKVERSVDQTPNRLDPWIQERNRIAAETGLQIARGVWRDRGPTTMELIGSPKA